MANAIRLEALPSVGFAISVSGQRYEFVGLKGYDKADGSTGQLAVWATNCWDCDDPFEAAMPLLDVAGSRRCPKCRKPGVPVSRRGGFGK